MHMFALSFALPQIFLRYHPSEAAAAGRSAERPSRNRFQQDPATSQQDGNSESGGGRTVERRSLLRPGAWKAAFNSYTTAERRNVMLYTAAMMAYKLGYECFAGSITTLTLQRWSEEERFGKLGLLQGLNLLFQCIGSILTSLVMQRLSVKTALVSVCLSFSVVPVLIMIIDSATGGGVPGSYISGSEIENYGKWAPEALFPLYCLAGICYGMMELIRRVVPRSLVGEDIDKLRQVDALVHVFYESAGAAGAFLSSYLILQAGSVNSLIVTVVFFALASTFWAFLPKIQFTAEMFLDFFRAIWIGGKLILSNRNLCWLPIAYSVGLYAHRYLENAILPMVAQGYLEEPSYTQILVGGSNLGELVGALAVLLSGNFFPTPIPWLRLDSVFLCLIWILPFYNPRRKESGKLGPEYAWALVPLIMFISFGWAAGDVSLNAFIQSSLEHDQSSHPRISSLGAAMAFLYTLYLVLFAVVTPLLGQFADNSADRPRATIHALGAVQFTVIAVLLLASSLIPRGSLALNPKLLEEADKLKLDSDDEGAEDARSIELRDLASTPESRVMHRPAGAAASTVVDGVESRSRQD